MNGTLLDRSEFPDGFGGVDELEAFMARPSRELVDDLAPVSGDILVLGAGGKIGPTLTKLARNAGAAMAVQPDPIRKWREQYARPCLRVDFEPLPESGTSFTVHVTELRLKHAFMLLTAQDSSDIHICDIALRAGFSDISHFNRLFHSSFGDAPKGVRANQQTVRYAN